jgi:hypothetical protein
MNREVLYFLKAASHENGRLPEVISLCTVAVTDSGEKPTGMTGFVIQKCQISV